MLKGADNPILLRDILENTEKGTIESMLKLEIKIQTPKVETDD